MGPVIISFEQRVGHVEQISHSWLVGCLQLIKWGLRARRALTFHTTVTLTKGTCLAGNSDTFINGRVCGPALAQTPDWLLPPGPLSLFHFQEPSPLPLGVNPPKSSVLPSACLQCRWWEGRFISFALCGGDLTEDVLFPARFSSRLRKRQEISSSETMSSVFEVTDWKTN